MFLIASLDDKEIVWPKTEHLKADFGMWSHSLCGDMDLRSLWMLFVPISYPG